MIRLARALVATLLLGIGIVQAGQNCEEKPITLDAASKAFSLASKLRDRLEASNDEVVILGRIGRDMSRYGLRYSHAGYAWRDHPKGRWLVRHALNRCGTAESDIYDEGLANFFMDDPLYYEVLVLRLKPELQSRLALALKQPLRLHEPRYNLVAYPFSSQYQNSNQWLLETLASAEMPGDPGSPLGREQAQRWLRQNGYLPSTLYIPTLTRLGGRITRANIAFDDHPFGRRMAGQIDVATVESIAAYIDKQGELIKQEVLTLP
ncbi:DUF2145 domain-containing protein [Parachitinimonas caeni]|uniref:DUF2145 domain-containing protein n=1 Tax=Parachitinimonas caeni TaxID=3031301 RepID=A0ABT7DTN6_9NEIS|nr:DUF2145 domain-containing protein [Parachitinimonas caeni]MDK2123386.1 DUF2145 domain-containing protein [Parachitinimonas caeni]